MVAFKTASSSDVEFEGWLACPSGRICVGDAESERMLHVPPGDLRVQVARTPFEFAEQVRLYLTPAG